MDLQKIFKTKRPLIGMVHLAPLLGVKDAPSIEENLKMSLKNALILKNAGYDAIIIENNYDLPHDIFVKPNVVASFTYIAQKIKEKINIPIGLSVLWNDYYTALSIAKIINAKFVRVPVFVDKVRTNYGEITGDAQSVINFRELINANEVAILTDIQVKHSELLNVRPIKESAIEAIQKGSDGLIITGKWTGDAPKTEDLEEVRNNVGTFPIFIGSGASLENIHILTKYADGIIIGTAIKAGENVDVKKNVNLREFDQQIDPIKAKVFRKKHTGYIS